MNPARVRTIVYSIDSRCRDESAFATSTDFAYKLVSPLKNVISLKMSSIELPNTSYNFAPGMSFVLKVDQSSHMVNIPIGNWDTATMESKLNQIFGSVYIGSFVAIFDPYCYNVTIRELNGKVFEMVFADQMPPEKEWRKNFGFMTGFRQNRYQGASEYVGEAGPYYAGSPYLFLQLSDYNVVTHQTPDDKLVNALAKILMASEKNMVVFDDQSFITREIKFPQPVTLSRLDIRLVDEYGDTVDLKGHEFSFTLEMTQVMSSDLYEKYRRQGTPF